MRVLLITDVQYDFLPGGALAVPEGDKIIPVINRIQEKFDLVVATQDWHPAGHESFASAHPGNKVYDVIEWHGLEQVLWPDHCVQQSHGADLDARLEHAKIAAIFRKGMDPAIDSYSAFFDNEKKVSTGLADYLKGKGVKELFICGLAADFCVAFSALDALHEGFETRIISDATRPINPDGFERAKKDFLSAGGRVVSSLELN